MNDIDSNKSWHKVAIGMNELRSVAPLKRNAFYKSFESAENDLGCFPEYYRVLYTDCGGYIP